MKPENTTVQETPAKAHIVHWKLDELDKIAARAVVLLRTGVAKSEVLAVSKAQEEVLDLHRQRRIYGRSHLKKIRDDLDRHLALYDAAHAPDSTPTPELTRIEPELPKSPATLADSMQILASAASPRTGGQVGHSPLPTVTPHSSNDLSDKLARSILSVLVPAFVDVFQETMEKVINQLPAELHQASLEVAEAYSEKGELPKNNVVTIAPRKIRQRVVLLGFRPETSAHIGDFDNLEIKYCQEIAEVRRAHNVGAVLLQATKFSAHLPKDIKRKFSRIILVSGGYTDATRQLHALNITQSEAQ